MVQYERSSCALRIPFFFKFSFSYYSIDFRLRDHFPLRPAALRLKLRSRWTMGSPFVLLSDRRLVFHGFWKAPLYNDFFPKIF